MFLKHSPPKNLNSGIQAQFENLYTLCNNVTKGLIQSRELSKNQATLDGYSEQLRETYNQFINFSKLNSDQLKEIFKDRFAERVKTLKNRVAESFLRLKLKFIFDSDLFQEITDESLEKSLIEFSGDDESTIDDLNEKIGSKETIPSGSKSGIVDETVLSDTAQSLSTPISAKDNFNDPLSIDNIESSFQITNKDKELTKTTHSSNSDSSHSDVSHSETTKMDPVAFLKLCANTINKNYSGDPLALDAFINSILIVQTTVKEHDNILKDFVISRLEAKALEALPDPRPTTTNEVIEALKGGIKLGNSDIITGKIIALKAENLSGQEFATKAEELALSLRRSYINEGITKTKANEMAIKETVKLCKSSSRNVLVKSILASATYTEPRDVIAKFLTETENEKNDNKNSILSFRGVPQNRGNYHNSRGQTSLHTNDRYQNRTYGNYNRSYGNNNRNQYNNFNKNRTNNYNSYRNQSNRANYSNSRNNFSRNQNYSRNQNGRSNQNNSNRNTQNVRFMSGSEGNSQSFERTLGNVADEVNELTLG